MAFHSDSPDEEVFDIRNLVTRLAERHGEDNPIATGYVLMGTYLTDEGERLWIIRTDPEMGHAELVGLTQMLAYHGQQVMIETMGYGANDDSGDV